MHLLKTISGRIYETINSDSVTASGEGTRGQRKKGNNLLFHCIFSFFIFVIFYHEHVLPSQKNKFKVKTKQ